MTRVLIVTRFFVRAGTETFLMNNFRHIDRKRFHMDFLVLNGDDSPFRAEIERLGGTLIFGHANLAVVKDLIPSIWKIYRVIRRGHYDVVHANCDLVNGCVLLAARLAGVKVRLSHSHNTDFREGGGHLRRFFYNQICPWLIRRCATGLLACGQQAGEDLYCRGRNGRPVKAFFTVIHNGIDVAHFLQTPSVERLAALRQELSIPAHASVYGNISRYDEQKNLLFAVDVFQAIHTLDPQAVFLLGGIDGPKKEAVVRKVADLGLDSVVREVGERADLPDLLELMDCFVLPSFFEGLPFIMLETQALSLPAVLSTGVPREVDFGLGLLHFIALTESPTVWAEAVLRTKREVLPADRIRQAFTERGYDIVESVKTLEHFYQSA